MALVAWILVWELVLAYGLAALRSPADLALALAVLLLGLGAGYYGLLGRYWQTVAWFVGLAWYIRSFGRYVATVDPILATAPEPFPLLIIMLYIPILPPAWMIETCVVEVHYWYARWRYE